ncbi:MAG: sigma-54 dependent transcriptional regulator [Holosporaceae bacterium]|jgi:two-component system nitrogen regulation response regulator NtrX|nr:sigma-54 dependent transcriptional regulator [Holosporaceae bacterium]
MSNETILIVDDEAEVRSLMSGVLSDEGYKTELAKDRTEALALIKATVPDLIFLDLWIDEDESAGLKIIEKIQKMNLGIPVVIISGHGTIDAAVQAIQKGAFDFIEKPFVLERLLITCRRALETRQLKKENAALKINKLDAGVFSVGKSSFASSFVATLDKISSGNSRIFIESKIGIGTEVIAHEIHKRSSRKDHPFIHVNCFSDNKENFSSELFGTEKFRGYLEKADGGTIFLEDVTRLHKDCQGKLLQFLQTGSYVLKNRKVYSDARIICSSSDDMETLMDCLSFSRELYYRLNIVGLVIPSLKNRREDIFPLIDYYLSHAEAIFGLKSKKFTEDSLAILQAYDWPGNILQLKNVVESSLINSIKSEEIDKNSLPPELTSSAKEKFTSLNVAKLISLQLKEAKEFFERDYLITQIERFSGNVSKTAEFIGMERSALHRKLRGLGIVSGRINKKDQEK